MKTFGILLALYIVIWTMNRIWWSQVAMSIATGRKTTRLEVAVTRAHTWFELLDFVVIRIAIIVGIIAVIKLIWRALP